MKSLALYIPIFILFNFIISCKKDNQSSLPFRLKSTSVSASTDTYKTAFEYEATGRIIKITYQYNTTPASISFDITYPSKEIIMARPSYEDANALWTDTIHMFMQGERVMKRIEHRFEYYKSTTYPKWTYIFDTTNYQYNNDDLLIKALRNSEDSTWFIWQGNNTEITQVTRNSGIANHIIEDRKLMSVKNEINSSFVEYSSTGTTYSTGTEESTLTCEYNKKFSNKTDFSNAAVLNELQLFSPLPMNRNYKYLPDKINFSTIKKYSNGGADWSSQHAQNYEFVYNSFGVVSGRVEAEMRYTFIY